MVYFLFTNMVPKKFESKVFRKYFYAQSLMLKKYAQICCQCEGFKSGQFDENYRIKEIDDS